MLDIVAQQPSTARFIATKLVRHFVSDTAAGVGRTPRGADLPRTERRHPPDAMRTSSTSPEFFSSRRVPVEGEVAVRAGGERVARRRRSTRQHGAHGRLVGRFGEPFYGHQAPNGWPECGRGVDQYRVDPPSHQLRAGARLRPGFRAPRGVVERRPRAGARVARGAGGWRRPGHSRRRGVARHAPRARVGGESGPCIRARTGQECGDGTGWHSRWPGRACAHRRDAHRRGYPGPRHSMVCPQWLGSPSARPNSSGAERTHATSCLSSLGCAGARDDGVSPQLSPAAPIFAQPAPRAGKREGAHLPLSARRGRRARTSSSRTARKLLHDASDHRDPAASRNAAGGAIDLDGFFGLHPALAPLKPLCDRGCWRRSTPWEVRARRARTSTRRTTWRPARPT